MKKMTRFIAWLICLVMLLGMLPAFSLAADAEEPVRAAGDGASAIPIYEDTSYSFAERAADLVARMSLSQKGSQMISSPAPAITAASLGGGALNVPATKDLAQYYWWNEGLHGYNRIDNGASVRGGGAGPSNATSYPQSLTVGSTWNPELYYREALQVSEEIRERTSRNSLGNAIDLNFYSPTVNLQRDPRWGRNEESYSEDPYLTVKMGSQYVLGLEGKDQEGNLLDPDGYYRLHSTIKHFVANNSESNRLNGGATTSLSALRNYYLAPYRGIIKATDVSSVMTAYSSLNGEPCSYSSYLMETMLRQTYGFSGHITSDCDAVGTMSRLNYRNPRTGATLTNEERLAGALAHGEDLECNGGYTGTGNYNSYSARLIAANVQTDKGLFTENTMDISLHRLLTARISTGEFDDNLALTQAATERIAAQQAADPTSGVYNQTDERLAILEQVNNEGVVMLQNKDNFLPLQIPASGEYKVVIVGAWQTNMYLGLYSASARNTAKQITIRQGIENAIRAKNPDATFTYITSDSVSETNRADIEAANVCVVVGGANNQYSAEDRDRNSIAMNNNQAAMFSQVGQWNPNTVAVMEYCGPVETYTFADNVKAILWSSFEGLRKVGFGNVITGAVNPSGKLTATWYHSTSDLPDKLNYDLYPSGNTAGRTYMFYKGDKVDYPFGYGLSFTSYEYSNLHIDKTSYDANDTVKVSFDVKNTGAVAGKEIAQLYIAQPDATAADRPIRRLEGFEKVELAPGETKTVSLEVAIPDLAYYSENDDCYSVDTGAYQVQVGKDSASANLTADFTVTGAMDVYPEVLTVKANAVGDTEAGIEERLIYNKGAVINPQLTVAMNNEKLYGYIIADQRSPIKQMKSTDLPEGMTFTYESNRPSVVRVTGDEIKAVGPGVATVTVTGTLDGVTVTDDFVVYVETSTDVDAITVDGEPLAKFAPDKYSYSMTLDSDKVIPVVAATSGNEDLDIVVTQAAALPGEATVVATDRDSGVSSTYTITFKVRPSNMVTDVIDFTTEADADKYEIVGQSSAAVAEGTGLALVTTRNSIETAGNQNSGNQATTPEDLVQVPVSGDWIATLETVFETNGARNGWYQFFGFFAAADDDLGATDLAGIRGGDGAIQDFVRTNGAITADTDLKSAPGFDTNGKTYFLRIQKEGTTYTCSRSEDGEDFTEMFVLPDTGVDAQYLVLDAYTGMTAGYKFTLKSLAIETAGNDWTETDEIEPGVQYLIVADDAYALNNVATNVGGNYSDGGQSLGATEVTVENGKVVSEVDDSMIWTIEDAEGAPAARDGAETYYIFDQAGAQILRRSGRTATAPMNVGTMNPSSPQYAMISFYAREDGSYAVYFNSNNNNDYNFTFSGREAGFDAPGVARNSWDGETYGSSIRLYRQGSAAPVKPEIASISVDGNEIEFDEKVASYNFEVARDSTEAPVVSAVAGNKKTEIVIEQAEGPTGKATVTATAGTKSKSYTLCFNYAPVDDYFADGTISDAWTIEKPLESEYQLVKGEGLKLITQVEDIYQSGANWHNAFTMPAMGNWQAVAKAFYPVTAELQNYQQLAFVLWQDEDNYVRINCQQSSLTIEPGKETNGTMATTAVFSGARANAADDGTATIYFQINKLGDTYTLGYSQDGADFTSVGSVTANYADPKLVLIAGQNTDNEMTWLNFEYVAITSKDGVDANSDFLTWACQNVADYVAADLPEETDADLALSPVPHGYTVELSASKPEIIDAEGRFTAPEADTDVDVTVTVSDGSSSASAVATVLAKGSSGPVELDKTALEQAIASAEAIDPALYTEESVATLNSALDAARAALESATTQRRIYEAAQALNDAVGALVVKPEPVEEQWMLAEDFEPGKTYIIVADDAYALNAQANAQGSLGATKVTIESDVITSAVTDDMLWTFEPAEGVDPATDGNALYLITDAAGSNIRRGSGGSAGLQLGTFDAGSARYFTWSLAERTAEDSAYTLYVNSNSSYVYFVTGADTGFTVAYASSSSWDNQTSGSSVRLYELTGGSEIKLDKTAIRAAIRAAGAVNREIYTDESLAAMDAAFEAARTALSEAETQEALDEAAAALNAAVAALEKKPIEPNKPVEIPDDGVQASNPYLPMWERIPDGEPRIFTDPTTGEERMYVYGSHDTTGFYCGPDHVVWSAPLTDLTDWRYEGLAIKTTDLNGIPYVDQNGVAQTLRIQSGHLFYAPDVVYNPTTQKYTLIGFLSEANPRSFIFAATSDTPGGPFTDPHFIGWGFDPAVLVDDVLDENGHQRMYLYWSIEADRSGWAAELDPETVTIIDGTTHSPRVDGTVDGLNTMFSKGDDPFYFFEGPSIRKIGSTYVLSYARSKPLAGDSNGYLSEIGYATSDNPFGDPALGSEWEYGGVIIDNKGELVTDPYAAGTTTYTYFGGNNHGGMIQAGDDWYQIYHRDTNKSSKRQSMAVKLNVYFDDAGKLKIDQAEFTSEGFQADGLNPYEPLYAAALCYALPTTGGSWWSAAGPVISTNDALNFDPAAERDNWYGVSNLKNQTWVGYKYYNFGDGLKSGDSLKLVLTLKELGAGTVNIYAANAKTSYADPEQPKTLIGTISLTGENADAHTVEGVITDTSVLKGKQAIYLEFLTDSTASIAELNELLFVKEEGAGVDTSALESAIAAAESEAAAQDIYTADSLAALNEALAEAKAVLANADATQEEIDAAAEALNEAIEALVVNDIHAYLEKLIEEAKALAAEAQAVAEEAKAKAEEAGQSAAEDKTAAEAAQAAAEEAQAEANAAQKAAEDAQAAAEAADADAAAQAAEAARQAAEAARQAAASAAAQASAQAAQAKAEQAQASAEAAQAAAEAAEKAAGEDKAAAEAAKAAAEAAMEQAAAAQKAAETAKAAADAANTAAAEAAKQAAADAAEVAKALEDAAALVAKATQDAEAARRAAEEAKAAALATEKANAKTMAAMAALGVDPDALTPEQREALADILDDALAAIDAAEDSEAVQKALDDAVAAIEALTGEEPPFLFDDVQDENKFYFDPVYWAYYADPQITNGIDATHFGPDNSCTRGQVVTFLWRAAGCPEPESIKTDFTDLKEGGFYEKAVAWAVENEITNGMTATTFAPDATCTRGQIVTFLWRFQGKPAPAAKASATFTDVDDTAFYADAVAWAVEANVTKGMTDTTFAPGDTCTRGQIVTFLSRAMQD